MEESSADPTREEVVKVINFLKSRNITFLYGGGLDYLDRTHGWHSISIKDVERIVAVGEEEWLLDKQGISKQVYDVWVKVMSNPTEYTCNGVTKKGHRCKNISWDFQYSRTATTEKEMIELLEEILDFYCPLHHAQRVIREPNSGLLRSEYRKLSGAIEKVVR